MVSENLGNDIRIFLFDDLGAGDSRELQRSTLGFHCKTADAGCSGAASACGMSV